MQTNEMFAVGRAEARVAFIAQGAIRCDRVAEREGGIAQLVRAHDS